MLTDVVNPPPPPARRPPLYRYGADLAALDELLYEVGGDVTDPTVCAAVAAWQQELHVGRAEKLDDTHAYLKRLEMERDSCATQAAEWKARRDARQAHIDAVRGGVKAHMERTGERKLASAKGVVFALVANGGVAPLLVPDGDRVPAEFLKVVTMIDGDKVRAAIAAGEDLDFASLGERCSHLRVR